MRVVGHRGFPARYPDNTLPGLIAASQVADIVEVDVRRSGDGKLVLAHDPELGGSVVAETPWSVLAEVDLGGGHRPCLLDEGLASLPGTPILLEIKNPPYQPGFEPDHRLALEAAERARPGDVVTSFNPDTVAVVRAVFPEVATGLCVAPGMDLDASVRLCLDLGHAVLVPSVQHPLDHLSAAAAAGLEVYPWVVNHPEQARALADSGVSGIISDDPATVAASLERAP